MKLLPLNLNISHSTNSKSSSAPEKVVPSSASAKKCITGFPSFNPLGLYVKLTGPVKGPLDFIMPTSPNGLPFTNLTLSPISIFNLPPLFEGIISLKRGGKIYA